MCNPALSYPSIMKLFLVLSFIFINAKACAQSLQLHYDLRHTIDPKHSAKDYPTLYFEYFRNADTGKIPKTLGPFLLKTQADLGGSQSNISQVYMQVFQQLRLWKPKLYVNVQYEGGLGVTAPPQYSYYIVNKYSIGINYPFKLGSAFVSSELDLKYAAYQKPSRDLSYSFYFWQGLFHYRAEFSGDLSLWSQNRNHGDELTSGLRSKQISFFAEPQVWYKLRKAVAIGSKINLYYHVLDASDRLQAYPTIAVRLKL